MQDLFQFLTSDMRLFIPLAITWLIMLIVGTKIYIDDLKTMKVKAKWLLLFVGVGFLGYYVSRITTLSFEWYDLLVIPAYILLTIVNNLINKNHIVGQGDIDIFNGSLSLMIPVIFKILSENYNGMTEVNNIHLLSLFMDMLIWLFIGLVVVSVIVLIREAYIRIKYIMKPYFAYKKEEREAKKRGESELLEETSEVEEDVELDTIEEKVEPKSDQESDIKREEQGNKKRRLLKTKVPVALSFMPLYFFMVYMAIYY